MPSAFSDDVKMTSGKAATRWRSSASVASIIGCRLDTLTSSFLVRTIWYDIAALSRMSNISRSTGFTPWRPSISTKTRASGARPRKKSCISVVQPAIFSLDAEA